MKCDELKARTARSIADEEEMLELGACDPIEQELVYNKDEVDAAIAELKDENRKLKRALWLARAERAMAESYSVLNDVPTSNRWVKALNKLKAKAEEYK